MGLPRWPGTFFLSVTRPFFQGDCGKSQTGRPPERAAGWQEVLTQVLKKGHVGGRVHAGARKSTKPLRNQQTQLTGNLTPFVHDQNVKSDP